MSAASGGERDGDRKVIEGLVRDQVHSGVDPRMAAEKARRAMLEADRRLRQQGKR